MRIFKENDFWIKYDEFDKSRICNWIDLDIYRDIYIINRKNSFKLTDSKKALKIQLESLCSDINKSLIDISSFIDDINRLKSNSTQVLEKYILSIIHVMDMSIWFDPSGFFL